MSNSYDLRNDQEYAAACHKRWMERRNRKQESPRYRDEWWAEQCGRCRYFIPLTGVLGSDYGACSNPASAFDGTVRFEHDGCVEFADAEEWAPVPDSTIEPTGHGSPASQA